MSKLKLITEEVTSLQIVESASTKDLYVEGIFSSAEEKNKNGRIYKKSTLEREINKLEKTIKGKSLWGELNHPASAEINLERAAILVETLNWKGNDLYGRAVVLDTPMGNIAKALMKKGKIGISSRGLGTVDESGYVNDSNYKLITWDLVGNPSNYPSWVNGIYEGKEWDYKEEIKETVDNVAEDNDLTISEAKKLYLNHIKTFISEITKNI